MDNPRDNFRDDADQPSPRSSPFTPKPKPRGGAFSDRPTLKLFTSTLWEYPSQHYTSATGKVMQGDKDYIGATPSWVIRQLLMRYTRENDLILDPFCGSGTTLDVARDLNRKALGYDLNPRRDDIFKADARKLPVEDGKVDFFFMDPPYGAHIKYSDTPGDIGHHDVHEDEGRALYFAGMKATIREAHRVLKNRRYLGLYVSDSYKKPKGEGGNSRSGFVPIGFELFAMLSEHFQPVDIITVVRHNQKLQRGNWHKAAEEGNFFLRGFNYLFIMKKQDANTRRE